MKRFFVIALTVLCCLPFVAMLSIYVHWRQNSPAPVGADIGWGMVILSSYPAIGAILVWLAYGLCVFMTSESLQIGPYFNGWRKRVGLLLLLISCIFCAGWVRSFYVVDTFTALGGRFESHNGSIERYASTMIWSGRIGSGVTTMYWSVPYLSILAPLVLLSAYLLLSPPRKPKSAAEGQPA